MSGLRYCKEFLEPGSTGPEADLLERSVGRAPSSRAYYHEHKETHAPEAMEVLASTHVEVVLGDYSRPHP